MKTRRSHPRRTLSPAIITVLIVAGIVVFAWSFHVLHQSLRPRGAAHNEVVSNDSVLETQVSNVASQFICACGSCNNETLDQCTCENAQKARQLVRTSIQAGRPLRQIVVAVDSAFGGRREMPVGVLEKAPESNELQRTEVLSHFRCPCGKCGMENLAECECNHPRGGLEVRAFLDRKISEKKYSQSELIAEIENAYGRKKY